MQTGSILIRDAGHVLSGLPGAAARDLRIHTGVIIEMGRLA